MIATPNAPGAQGAHSAKHLLVEVEAMVRKGEVDVPAYPAIAMKIRRVVCRGDYGIADLEELIASDPSLAAKVLRYANAAGFMSAEEATSLRQAMLRLGARSLESLVVAIELGRVMRQGGPLDVLRSRVWRSSLLHAHLCQALAPTRAVDPDTAYTAGLLHDFGALLAIHCFERCIRGVEALPPLTLDAWQTLVDRYHVELGMVLAARWQLAEAIEEVIRAHHQPGGEGPYASLVHLVADVDAWSAAWEESHEATLAQMRPSERDAFEAAMRTAAEAVASLEAMLPARASGDAAWPFEPAPSPEEGFDAWPTFPAAFDGRPGFEVAFDPACPTRMRLKTLRAWPRESLHTLRLESKEAGRLALFASVVSAESCEPQGWWLELEAFAPSAQLLGALTGLVARAADGSGATPASPRTPPAGAQEAVSGAGAPLGSGTPVAT
jgi:HD-like signal output (HDOD) protein